MNTRLSRQEFELTDHEFHRLRVVVLELTGIALADSKRELLYSRLARRLRKLKLTSFGEYCDMVESGFGDEVQELTNAITTNLTSFFRENYHFEQLASEVLPQIERDRSTIRRMRFWSAGCSTGEEPYSLAMILRESLGRLNNWDIRLLATDIDSKVIEAAAAGAYETERLSGLGDNRASRWFSKSAARLGYSVVSPELRSLITFKQLNLLDPWPMSGLFDVIFCRNVVIYFDKDTQRRLFDRMADLQEPGGWLFIGHSENLFNVTNRYKPVGRTVYRRIE
jgi:chemotaxis protein methyltransferase CheR